MSRLERVLRHRIAVALVGGALVGLAIGAIIPPASPGAGAAARRGWRVPGPQAVARVTEPEFSRVRAAPIWGATAGAATVKAASWKLIGIMSLPEPIALVAAGSGRESLHLKVGDALPDGGTLRAIGANGLTFVRDGCGFERLLYSSTDSPVDGSCAAASSAAPSKSPDQAAK
ncbi:hypothetical protein [Cognatilysobacter segetis]|uniref:hypothetical protein n=1 Tax=Cognatilysobacter segetis TaxID=2492394 RepID=UPI001060415C|nr:hypothetical protein [Lysobacter segetis]